MRVVFTGTAEFAAPSLQAVVESSHEVIAVVTQPDRPSGRGMSVRTSPIKEVALAHGIRLLQPEKIGSTESISQIMSLGPIDLMIVVAYGQKIPRELLDWPAQGVVNVHGSILPKYRGAAPIQHAIMAGETETGATTMLMDEGWDTGDILLQETLQIAADENAGELASRLSLLGSRLLVRTLAGLADGAVAPIPQDDELATYAPALARDAGVLDWSLPADVIVNRVRGCTPRPGAFTKHGGVVLKIWGAFVHDIDERHAEPGEVIACEDSGIAVAAASGSVLLTSVQPESRKRMPAADYSRGAKLRKGERFEVRFVLR